MFADALSFSGIALVRVLADKYREMMKAKVIVMPKGAVLDPQGNAVRDAMRHLGMPEVRSVRIGKYMEIDIDGQNRDLEPRLHRLCRDLLSNPVIEEKDFASKAPTVERPTSNIQRARRSVRGRVRVESAAIFLLRGVAAARGAYDWSHRQFFSQPHFDFARMDSRSHSRLPGGERLSR